MKSEDMEGKMRFLATDFDDTLYFHDGRGFRTEDIDAIHRFQKAGNKFGLCTGRSISMYPGIEKQIGDRFQFDFLIFANGCCIVDEKMNPVYERYLPEEFIRFVMENVRDLPVTFHHRTGLYSSMEPSRPVDDITVMNHDYSMLPDLNIYEISIDYSLPGAEEVIDLLSSQPGVISAKNSAFCDFNPAGTSKGEGLDLAAEKFGFRHAQTAAIGDSYNDISMISQAQTGFTFPQSDAKVRQAADVLCDGVHEAIDILMENDSAE